MFIFIQLICLVGDWPCGNASEVNVAGKAMQRYSSTRISLHVRISIYIEFMNEVLLVLCF